MKNKSIFKKFLILSCFATLAFGLQIISCGEKEEDACDLAREDCWDRGGTPTNCHITESGSSCTRKEEKCECDCIYSEYYDEYYRTASILKTDPYTLSGSWNVEGEWIVITNDVADDLYQERISGTCFIGLEGSKVIVDCDESFHSYETEDVVNIREIIEFKAIENFLIYEEEHNCTDEEISCLCSSEGIMEANNEEIRLTIYTKTITCPQKFETFKLLDLTK